MTVNALMTRRRPSCSGPELACTVRVPAGPPLPVCLTANPFSPGPPKISERGFCNAIQLTVTLS
jgi:hypothetical protein